MNAHSEIRLQSYSVPDAYHPVGGREAIAFVATLTWRQATTLLREGRGTSTVLMLCRCYLLEPAEFDLLCLEMKARAPTRDEKDEELALVGELVGEAVEAVEKSAPKKPHQNLTFGDKPQWGKLRPEVLRLAQEWTTWRDVAKVIGGVTSRRVGQVVSQAASDGHARVETRVELGEKQWRVVPIDNGGGS